MAKVNAWNAAHPDEQWTVLVTTDHGHQPQLGFGHGFQSPDETSTFVIANGPQFEDGYINTAYEIIDTTPTVMSIFGGTAVDSDGVPLTTLSDSDEDPVDLHQALEDEIAQNDYPDIITNVALSLRTIFATLPYYVYMFGNDASGALPDVPCSAGRTPLRRPVRGDERPRADRRPRDRRDRRQHLPAVATAAADVPAGGRGDLAGLHPAGLRGYGRAGRVVWPAERGMSSQSPICDIRNQEVCL